MAGPIGEYREKIRAAAEKKGKKLTRKMEDEMVAVFKAKAEAKKKAAAKAE